MPLFTQTLCEDLNYLEELRAQTVIERRMQSYSITHSPPGIISTSTDTIRYYWDHDRSEGEKRISLPEIGGVTAMILGINGLDRLNKFKQYPDGWDFGSGSSMSGDSLNKMEYFLNQFVGFHIHPSIFMSNKGNLILGWEDRSGGKVELEFCSNHIEYYIEAIDEEDEIPFERNQIQNLVSKLQNI